MPSNGQCRVGSLGVAIAKTEASRASLPKENLQKQEVTEFQPVLRERTKRRRVSARSPRSRSQVPDDNTANKPRQPTAQKAPSYVETSTAPITAVAAAGNETTKVADCHQLACGPEGKGKTALLTETSQNRIPHANQNQDASERLLTAHEDLAVPAKSFVCLPPADEAHSFDGGSHDNSARCNGIAPLAIALDELSFRLTFESDFRTDEDYDLIDASPLPPHLLVGRSVVVNHTQKAATGVASSSCSFLPEKASDTRYPAKNSQLWETTAEMVPSRILPPHGEKFKPAATASHESSEARHEPTRDGSSSENDLEHAGDSLTSRSLLPGSPLNSIVATVTRKTQCPTPGKERMPTTADEENRGSGRSERQGTKPDSDPESNNSAQNEKDAVVQTMTESYQRPKQQDSEHTPLSPSDKGFVRSLTTTSPDLELTLFGQLKSETDPFEPGGGTKDISTIFNINWCRRTRLANRSQIRITKSNNVTTRRRHSSAACGLKLRSVGDLESITIDNLLRADDPICRSLVTIQHMAPQIPSDSWFRRFLYRPRMYCSLSLTKGPLTSRLNSYDYKVLTFYRRMTMEFIENWTIPKTLIVSRSARRKTRGSGQTVDGSCEVGSNNLHSQGSGLISPGSGVRKPICDPGCTAGRLDAAAGAEPTPGMVRGLRSDCLVSFYVPPFSLFATRVTNMQLRQFKAELPRGYALRDFIGRCTRDYLTPVKPNTVGWATSSLDNTSVEPAPTDDFFGVPYLKHTRIIARLPPKCRDQNLANRPGDKMTTTAVPGFGGDGSSPENRNGISAVADDGDPQLLQDSILVDRVMIAAVSGEVLAVSSQPLPKYSAAEFVRSYSPRKPSCVPPLPHLSTSMRHTPQELKKAHLRYRNLTFLIGGKDMLALDWLPFVSRMLHYDLARGILLETRRNTNPAIRSAYHGSVLLYEYPGYGFSTGYQSPKTCTDAACELLDQWLEEQAIIDSPIPLVIIAYSLGCGVAMRTVTEIIKASKTLNSNYPHLRNFQLKHAVFLAPPTNVEACAVHALRIPKFVGNFALDLAKRAQSASMQWDNIRAMKEMYEEIATSTMPAAPRLTLLHGARDDMVAPWMSLKLIDTAKAVLQDHEARLGVAEDYSAQRKRRFIIECQEAITHEVIRQADHATIAADPACQAKVHALRHDPQGLSVLAPGFMKLPSD